MFLGLAGGGIAALTLLMVIAIFYAENFLLRFFLLALLCIQIGIYVFWIYEADDNDALRAYGSLGIVLFIVAMVAVSKIKPYRGP